MRALEKALKLRAALRLPAGHFARSPRVCRRREQNFTRPHAVDGKSARLARSLAFLPRRDVKTRSAPAFTRSICICVSVLML